MTVVDRPDNGQDEGRWVVTDLRAELTGETVVTDGRRVVGYFHRPEDAERAAAAVNAGRAGAGEQQRERVARWLEQKYLAVRAGQPWSQSADADELLSKLGGPQPDGEAVAAARACWCAHCEGIVLAADHPTNWVARIGGRRFIVCRDCGDKRCPRAAHHDRPCTARADREASDPGPQCPSSSHGADGWRCEHRAGHDGGHRNGEVEWP